MCKNEIFLLSQKNLLRYYILLKYFKMYKKFGSTMLHILITANHANVRDANIRSHRVQTHFLIEKK